MLPSGRARSQTKKNAAAGVNALLRAFLFASDGLLRVFLMGNLVTRPSDSPPVESGVRVTGALLDRVAGRAGEPRRAGADRQESAPRGREQQRPSIRLVGKKG